MSNIIVLGVLAVCTDKKRLNIFFALFYCQRTTDVIKIFFYKWENIRTDDYPLLENLHNRCTVARRNVAGKLRNITKILFPFLLVYFSA